MHRITHNWNLKLISLVLAVILWSHVRGEVNPVESAVVDVPLRFRAPSGFVLRAASLPSTVSVTLRGPRLALRDVTGGALPNPLSPAAESSRVVRGAVRAWLEVARPRIGRQQAIVQTSSSVPDVEASLPRPAEVAVVLQRASSSDIAPSGSLRSGVSSTSALRSPSPARASIPASPPVSSSARVSDAR